jgi:RNAse (barnase) inhibitor barstar
MSAIVTITASYYAENNTRYVFLDGGFCKEIEDCYVSLERQLSIPGYFGRNLDALDEVLNDLDWITEEKIKIIIADISSLMKNELKRKDDFLEILHTASNPKIEIIYLGKAGK